MSGAESVRHLAVVMDGNQRWARSHGLPGPLGHKEGAKAVKTLVKASVKAGIKFLTLFAFSSENWKRPAYEVELLMQLFCEAIDEQLRELHLNKIRLRFMGDLSSFSSLLQEKMCFAEQKTSKNCGMQLIVAVNYGGQWDLTQAAKSLALEALRVSAAQIQEQQHPENVCETSVYQAGISALVDATTATLDDLKVNSLAAHLNISDLPPVDLFIRTSGEKRISNFLLWQLAYAELYFTDVLWPDFNEASLHEALQDFAQRQRRYGQSSEALLHDEPQLQLQPKDKSQEIKA